MQYCNINHYKNFSCKCHCIVQARDVWGSTVQYLSLSGTQRSFFKPPPEVYVTFIASLPVDSFKHLSQWWTADLSRQSAASSDDSIGKFFLICFPNCLPATTIPGLSSGLWGHTALYIYLKTTKNEFLSFFIKSLDWLVTRKIW